jgi:NADPH-dependent dioxygenase
MTASPQVLVVGAGPVGLTVAHELARRGMRVRIVEALAAPATTSRAIATHPRTLEVYDAMGVVGEILKRGRRVGAFTMFHRGRRLVRLDADYRTMPTRYPYTVIIEQVQTEAVLREALAGQGVKVEFGVRLEALEQDGRGVRARLTHENGTAEQVDVPWLVGCDGGHSTVRKQLGLKLAGESSETWMLADAVVDCDVTPDSLYWIHSGAHAMMMVPLPGAGRWRLLDTGDVLPGADSTSVAAHYSAKLSAGLGRPVRVAEPEWVSVFTFQQRAVSTMQVGRCLVAGDAAHVHSPASGQGMNTGLHEAFNLAWKLSSVIHGDADATLLNTYSSERVPIGAALLGSTQRATFLVQLKNSLAGVALPVVFAVVRNVRPIRLRMQRSILGAMSGLRLSYPDSPLTVANRGRAGSGPAPGERVTSATVDLCGPGGPALAAALRDGRWTLLVGEGAPDAADAAARYERVVSVRVLSAREPDSDGMVLTDPTGGVAKALGLVSGGWALVRPDGYLAARGERFAIEQLDTVLAHLLGRDATTAVTTDT